MLRWPELQFPYTSTGKLLRRKVAQWACGSAFNQRAGVGQIKGDALLDLIAEITGERPAGADNSLRLSEDLHLDSLGRVQMQSSIEQKLGTELDDDAIAAAETLGDLRALIGTGTSSNPSPEPSESAGPVSLASAQVAEKSENNIYPTWPWSRPVRLIRIGFIELVIRPLTWLLAAPHVVYDTDELPQGPLLIIANHVSAYDGPLVLYALPPRLRHNVAIAMSGEMLLDFRRGRGQGNAFYNLLAPAAYWLVTALVNVFPLPRLRGFRRSFEHAGRAMDRGYSVLIFPEGARSPDAALQSFRQGTGLLAQESRVPVLPVALAGLGEMRAKGWFRSGRLEIRVGSVIPVKEDADPAALTSILEASIRQLLAE